MLWALPLSKQGSLYYCLVISLTFQVYKPEMKKASETFTTKTKTNTSRPTNVNSGLRTFSSGALCGTFSSLVRRRSTRRHDTERSALRLSVSPRLTWVSKLDLVLKLIRFGGCSWERPTRCSSFVVAVPSLIQLNVNSMGLAQMIKF